MEVPHFKIQLGGGKEMSRNGGRIYPKSNFTQKDKDLLIECGLDPYLLEQELSQGWATMKTLRSYHRAIGRLNILPKKQREHEHKSIVATMAWEKRKRNKKKGGR